MFRNLSRQASMLDLYLFPYAGGGSASFRSWTHHLPATVGLIGVVLAGRESRIEEPGCSNLHQIATEVAAEMAYRLHRPFALYGHSMGALLAFEVARLLKSACCVEPVTLFVSGARGPHRLRQRCLHAVSNEELKEELIRLNGTPSELLDDEDLLRLRLPVLRADLAALETYTHRLSVPLSCPLIAHGGLTDPDVTREDLAEWRSYTLNSFSVRLFEGDHFFVHSKATEVCASVGHDLARYVM